MRPTPFLLQIGAVPHPDTLAHDALRAFVILFGALVLGGIGLLALGIRRRREFTRLGMIRPREAADLASSTAAIEKLALGVGRRELDLEAERRERQRATEEVGHHRELLAQAQADRIRLGRDLHDRMIQALYAAGMTLESARPLLASNPAEADSRIARAIDGLNTAIRDARGWIDGLSPEAVRAAGVTGAIRAAVEPLLTHGQLRLEMKVDEDAAVLLEPGVTVQIIPIVREAASNALRHGKATRLSVRLERGERSVCLLIQDDGAGFTPGPSLPSGRGLENMRARAESLGGALAVTSEPGQGTRILLTFRGSPPPLNPESR